jgi:cell division protein FtsI (penicillin-binding protein 3)
MFLLIVTGIALTLFAGRLVELQAVNGKALAAEAVDQRLRTQAIPAPRGAILDSVGQPLALTVEARNLVADQTKITNPVEVADTLGPVLGADPQLLA